MREVIESRGEGFFFPLKPQGLEGLTMNDDHNPFLWDSGGDWHFCRFCKHLHSLIGKLTCDVFPEGIPKELTSTLILHDKPMLGQKNDIVFAPSYK